MHAAFDATSCPGLTASAGSHATVIAHAVVVLAAVTAASRYTTRVPAPRSSATPSAPAPTTPVTWLASRARRRAWPVLARDTSGMTTRVGTSWTTVRIATPAGPEASNAATASTTSSIAAASDATRCAATTSRMDGRSRRLIPGSSVMGTTRR
jgi:hypothetical protein